MAKPLPCWAIWLHMPTLTTHQATCLSFGLDPSRITAYDRTGKSWGWSANRLFHSVPGFNNRKTLFSACHRGGLSALELSKWAQSVGWNIPTELAKLAPVPVDALEALPAETVHAALLEVIATGADIEELLTEIARTGITFTMRDGVETVEIPDGTVRGRKEPLSGIYHVLAALDGPKVRKLHTLIRGSGSSGSGATASNYQPAPAAHVSAHAMAAPGHQATTQAPDAAVPAPVETVEQRRARYLAWHNEEFRINPRGALQRVYEREAKQNPKADRSNIGKDVERARGTAETPKLATAWTSQLVQDGKRKG